MMEMVVMSVIANGALAVVVPKRRDLLADLNGARSCPTWSPETATAFPPEITNADVHALIPEDMREVPATPEALLAWGNALPRADAADMVDYDF